jgi:hypothetical protein
MTDDDPITLREACEIVFANKIKVATLRVEAERGKLVIFRVGRRDFTTLRSVREMVRKCQDAGQHRGSTSTASDASGLSETARVSSAQAALNQTVLALKRDLPHTSARSINRSAGRTR